MSAVCIIPARGNSQRIPGKNRRMFHGKPIIAYSIEAAKESRLFDEIWVSTDDDEIASVAVQFGAKWHPRSKELSDNDIGTREVTSAVVQELYPKVKPDFVCCLYATAPLMDVDDLKLGYDRLRVLAVDHAISVGYPPLQDAAQFYWSDTLALLSGIEYFGSTTVLIPIKPERVCDINTEEDWLRCEQMYLALKENK